MADKDDDEVEVIVGDEEDTSYRYGKAKLY